MMMELVLKHLLCRVAYYFFSAAMSGVRRLVGVFLGTRISSF